jgi:putative ABC transport system ATP-binding protein
MDLLREVALDQDRAVIIVTHDNRVFDLADRILDMEDGRIVKDERPARTPQPQQQSQGAPH